MQTRFWLFALGAIVVIAISVLLVTDPGREQAVVKVDLATKSALPPVRQAGLAASGKLSENVLHVAIAGVLSPTQTLEYYQDFVAYIGRKLDRPVNIVLRPTYSEINDLIRGRRVELAFVCTLAYVQGNQAFGLELLVAPQIRGETVYYSYLIAPKESSAMRLEDLRGAAFAFTDPLSNTGHLVPVYQLSLLKETPSSFFSRYVFTYSHDTSVLAVANKLVDAAAVDSLVYDQLMITKRELVSKTRVIAIWGPYGIPPVVVSPALDRGLKQQLRDLFLNLHESDEGKAILANLGIDRFVVASDNAYDSIREMKGKMGW